MAFGLWMVLVAWRAAFKAVIPGDVSAAVSLPEIIDSLAKLKGSSLVLIPDRADPLGGLDGGGNC